MYWKPEIKNRLPSGDSPKVKKWFKAQSLIEVIVGIGIIGVVFTSVSGLIYVALKSAKVSRERSLAQSLLNDMSTAVKSVVNFDWHALFAINGSVGHWSFDDGLGSTSANNLVLDEIFGNNGVISLGSSGNTSLASAWQNETNCKADQCLSFDGTDDVLNMGNSSSTQLTGDMSLSFWVYPESLSGTKNLFGKDSLREFNTRINSDGSFTYLHGNGSVSYSCTVSSFFSINTWAHVAVSRAVGPQSVIIYKNGQPQSVSCGSWTSVASSTSNLRFGYAGDGYFQGRVDEARVYNQVLSASDAAKLYSGINKVYPNNNSGIWEIKPGEETVNVSGIDFNRHFMIQPVQRNSSGDIVSSGGDNDPTTKKIRFASTWGSNYSMIQEEYVTRTSLSNVFTQTDWSGGPGQTAPVFSAVNTFDTASSGIDFSVQGLLTAEFTGLSNASSTMDSFYHWAWTEVAGWIDFINVDLSTTTSVFYGLASSGVDSISMNCADTSCASSNYKVYLTTATTTGYLLGDLYGYAWSDNVGWISFNCNQTALGGSNDCGSSDYKVNMNITSGVFTGYAWNDILGWMSFNCSDLGICGSSDYKVVYNLYSLVGFAQELLSPIFDTQEEKGVVPLALVWQGTLEPGTVVKFQLASSNSKNGPWNFVGSDGTSSSFYPSSGTSQSNSSIPVKSKYHYNQRYFRYKLLLETSASETPTINDISIVYNK